LQTACPCGRSHSAWLTAGLGPIRSAGTGGYFDWKGQILLFGRVGRRLIRGEGELTLPPGAENAWERMRCREILCAVVHLGGDVIADGARPEALWWDLQGFPDALLHWNGAAP